ncbi:MAG: hypothetical protein ACD_7C00348G0003 [uncultured bacterium]|nr:MAG: hypothetical protein ACD_7C00348G0003 [uncultured bacterium]HBR79957.1 hypothetical protein [Candidatus Moranbacteria bacterium]
MNFKFKYWLNSLSKTNFYFIVIVLVLAIIFIMHAGNKQKAKFETITQTKMINSCNAKEKFVLNKERGDKIVKGILIDDKEDYFFQENGNVIFLETKTKKFNPILGRVVEISGNLRSTDEGIYYIRESEVNYFTCTGEDLVVPEKFEDWMVYFDENINNLSLQKDNNFSWKIESFILKDFESRYVYINYSNFDSALNDNTLVDRTMLVKLNDFQTKNIEIILDTQLDDDGKLMKDDDADIFKNRLDIAEYRLNIENQWKRVK